MSTSVTISNSKFLAGRDTNLNYNHWQTNNHYGGPIHDSIQLLRDHATLGALHDSAERPDPPKCHPHTREADLERIDLWARGRSDDAKSILWLTDAAGASKTAIAQTLIERWKRENLIILNFFFWRTSSKRNHKTHLIPTLAFQLAKGLPTVKIKLDEAVKDESIFERNLESQVQELIISPLEHILVDGQLIIIVIDGLDELCADLPKHDGFPGQNYQQQQREILEAVFLLAKGSLPSEFSLHEHQIRTSFGEPPLVDLSLPLSLVNEPNAEADITLYLSCKFAEIRSRHPGIDPSWPPRDQILILGKKSSGQFIYPSTVVKFISTARQFPIQSLEEVLALQAKSSSRKGHPLAELDALYTLVLRSVAPESLKLFLDWCAIIIS